MINALRAEARRLLSRRLTLMTLVALLGMVGLFQLQVSSLVAPPSAAELAQSKQDFDEYVQDWEANHEEWEAECVDSGGTPAECAQPRPDPAEWGFAAVPFDQAVTGALEFAVYLGGLALFVVLASFIGAEATTGSLANWLTFIPNRTTVLGSKLIVAAVFSALTGAALGLLSVGVSAVVTTLHDQPLTGLGAMVAMAGRGMVVVTVFGVLGSCIGTLTGSTGASIGVLLGGIFLTYVRLILAFSSRWAERLSPWSPEVNLAAILDRGTTYQVSAGPGAPVDSGGYVDKALSFGHGMGYWAVVVAVLIVAAFLVFRRRDVT
jgi:ABC-2 type transport system permease protein